MRSGLARLAIDMCLMARLPDDAFGRILRRRAIAEGLDLSAALLATELTTVAVVSLGSEGRETYDFYAHGTVDWQWTDEDLAHLPNRTTILHHGSLASRACPGAERIARLAARARADSEVIVSYDPNVRPLLLRDPRRSRRTIERNVTLAHIVKASAEDVKWLYEGFALDDVAARWLALGPSPVVLTDGANGACAYASRLDRMSRPGISVEVVDTVGAADSFTSAFLASCLRRAINTPTRVAEATKRDIVGMLDDTNAASAITCRRAGADPPLASELFMPPPP